MSYVTGKTIRELRERKGMTQKELADVLKISDKTVSKWETERGLPDIGLILVLAESLGVSVAELLSGEYTINSNRCANLRKIKFYVCPVCGNVIQAVGEGSISCCGISLPFEEEEEEDEEHRLVIEVIENEYFVHMEHPMTKEHSISFLAYVTGESVQFMKQYPEQNVSGRFMRKGHGVIYAFCNRHGLYRKRV